jgi:hypothetical protein
MLNKICLDVFQFGAAFCRSEFASQRKATLGLYWAIGVNYAAYKTENRFGKSRREGHFHSL